MKTWGNVTVNPLSPAIPARDLEIEEILDCDTGEYIDVRKWISGWRYEQIIEKRVDIRAKLELSSRFRCPVCAVPVYIVSNQYKNFYFKHQIEDGSCPAQTRNPLSREDILARKYHGLRESEPHRRIKTLIVRSLSADPQYSATLTEHQWRSAHDASARRRPDVQATGPMGRLAFEVQLSTTFLDVVVARRSFYREEGALLVWVMGWFDPNYRRLTTDDLLFTNNSNILIVDEETATQSERAGRFFVRCHFRRPMRDGDRLIDEWESSVVPFDTLTFEHEEQRCWYVDYDGDAVAIRAAIDEDLHIRETVAADGLRNRLFEFWIDREPSVALSDTNWREWADLCSAFANRGITLPEHPEGDSDFVALMNGLASAKEGRPIGWAFKQIIEVGHKIADSYPKYVIAFGHALRYFGRSDLMGFQDRSGKWEARKKNIRESINSHDGDFFPSLKFVELIGFMMPGVDSKIKALVQRA